MWWPSVWCSDPDPCPSQGPPAAVFCSVGSVPAVPWYWPGTGSWGCPLGSYQPGPDHWTGRRRGDPGYHLQRLLHWKIIGWVAAKTWNTRGISLLREEGCILVWSQSISKATVSALRQASRHNEVRRMKFMFLAARSFCSQNTEIFVFCWLSLKD